MPSPNVIKQYTPNTYYHIYNRGVEKRLIFLDEQDYSVFLRYLKLYLSPIEQIRSLCVSGEVKLRFVNLNLSSEVELISFALMPNHFHLLIKQFSENGIIKFMRRITTSYVMYFNKKYHRTGTLFEGPYKGVIVSTDEYLVHLSRYIHRNPKNILDDQHILEYSSYPYFLKNKSASWIKPNIVMQFFRSENEYKTFVENYDLNQKNKNSINHLKLESECS